MSSNDPWLLVDSVRQLHLPPDRPQKVGHVPIHALDNVVHIASYSENNQLQAWQAEPHRYHCHQPSNPPLFSNNVFKPCAYMATGILPNIAIGLGHVRHPGTEPCIPAGALTVRTQLHSLDCRRSFANYTVTAFHITMHLPPAGGSLGFCAFSICAMRRSKPLPTFSL